MQNTSEQLRRAKEDPKYLEQIQHPPGVLISDIDISDLAIEVMPSGFPSLDEYMLLKKNRGELIVIGGRTSHGKSALMFQLAYNVAHYTTVHIFSLEMSKEQIMTRFLAQILNRPIGAIQSGMVNAEDLEEAKKKIETLPIILDDESGLNFAQIADRIRSWKNLKRTGLVVVDYLQLIAGDQYQNRALSIGANTKALKNLAKELSIPILVGAQLNRNNETRGKSSGDYRPVLSDLAESGAIENDCDVAAIVHRESRYTGLRADEADVLVVKNRMGTCGDVTMGYIGSQTRFDDLGKSGI